MPISSVRSHSLRRGVALLSLVLWGAGTSCMPGRESVDDEFETTGPGGDDAEKLPGSLTVTPGNTIVTVSGVPQTVSFRCMSSKLGDVTSLASWTISDSSVGTMSKGKLMVQPTLMKGGAYKVYASLRGATASVPVLIKLIAPDELDPSAPVDAKDWFSGSSGGPAPDLVYPFDQTLMAANVLQLAIQWRAGSGQSVFRVSVVGDTYERSFYVGNSICPSNQCTYRIDDKLWSAVGHSAQGQDIQLTVSGSSGRGAVYGSSNPVKVSFAPEDIKGGLYYFSPTIRGIKRVPLGASKPVDFISNGDETGCAGCHAVSRDGKKVAVEFGSGQTRTGSTVVDGINPKLRAFPLTPSIPWNFAWFNSGGDKLITNWTGTLKVRDAKSGAVLETVQPAQIGGLGLGAMPEWSPDNKWLAFVRYTRASAYDFELTDSGDIVVMPYNGGAFGPAVTVVAAKTGSEVHFWPSWSPDSKWLVFNTQTCSGSCQQYNAVQTRLRLVKAIDDVGQPVSGGAPIDLLAGTHQPNSSNNWPKFAPFLQNNRFAFIVYSARYRYGFAGGSQPQLFMFGLDLEKARAGGQDPSFQPIWLPFQETNTGNHSAIWTTDVACASDSQCPGEFRCIANMCVPRIG
jgi:hypothetical protein